MNNEKTSHLETNESEETRKKKMVMLKNALKYCKGRSLSLDMILACKQQTDSIDGDLKTYEMLSKNIKELYDGTVLIQSIKNMIKLIQNSVICAQVNTIKDTKLSDELLNKVNGVIYFSKNLIKQYYEKINELEVVEKKKAYTCVQNKYCEHLDALKANKIDLSDDDAMILEKAKAQVYKINLMRAIKAVLIGYTSAYHSDLLPAFDQFANPLRRNLTIDDFFDTWDIGLSS